MRLLLWSRPSSRCTFARTLATRLTASALGCALVSGCGGSTPAGPGDGAGLIQSHLARDSAPAVAPADLTQLSADNTKFAFDLYQDLAAGDETSNLFYSPYSISIALAMTYAGAGDPTAGQMATALDFKLAPAALHPAFDALDLALASRATGQAGVDGKAFQLNVADSLWGETGFAFEQPFLDTLAKNYGAGMHVVDFTRAAESARGSINQSVSDQTASRIENLIPEGGIDTATRLVLVNAIYFNAAWDKAFETQSTQPGPFHHLDGTTSNPDMMGEELFAGVAQGPNFQAVELPYAGRQTSMVVILPDDGAFASVEGALTGASVAQVFSSLAQQQVTITLPKFTIEGKTISLKNELSKLGMADAFTANANFAGITTAESLYIGDVFHQAFVKVTEAGTEAAAATAVVTRAGAAPAPSHVIAVDRPFFFLIRDIPTNTVLFVGRELDPM